MNKKALLAAAAAFILAACPAFAQIRGFRQTQLKEWEFSKNGSSWEKVTVPHSYNAIDGRSPSYYRGEATYRCEFNITKTNVDHFILFEGAAQMATVSVNGERISTHRGGYTPFCVKISDAVVEGTNVVEVVCDNTENLQMAPVTSDFNKNGGLHNPVWLLEMEDIYMSPEENGMYRIRVETPEVGPKKVTTNVVTRIVNSSNTSAKVLVRVQLLETNGILAYQADREVVVSSRSEYSFNTDFFLTGIHFWDGVKDPYRYTIRVELFKGKRMTDIAECQIGYRYFGYDKDQGFMLNGRPYPLRGVAMHQDMEGKASALTEDDYRRDYKIVKELGANFLRLAHYPHNDMAFSLCDSLGIVVQTEVPWVNVCGEKAKQSYFNNIERQMKEMIQNYYNHPSIIFWGMWNELDTWGNKDELQGPLDVKKVAEHTEELYEYAKDLDPDRLVGFSDDSRLERTGYPDLEADYCSENMYFGWYWTPDSFTGFTDGMKRVRQLRRQGPVNVSEYGAGINPWCHVWDPAKAIRTKEDDSMHPEEYGNLFHESYVRQIMKMPWLGFTSAWVLFDFPVADRKEGYMDSSDGKNFKANEDRMYMNDKGLVTRDRELKKDVFYLYKSLWNKSETTVYITGRRLTARPGSKPFTLKVYSNAKGLTLYQNDKQVAKKAYCDDSTGVIWEFPGLRLSSSTDTFRVVASDGTSDEVTISKL